MSSDDIFSKHMGLGVDVDDEARELAALVAHIIVGVDPYIDISVAHCHLMDFFSQPELSMQDASEVGGMIQVDGRIHTDKPCETLQ